MHQTFHLDHPRYRIKYDFSQAKQESKTTMITLRMQQMRRISLSLSFVSQKPVHGQYTCIYARTLIDRRRTSFNLLVLEASWRVPARSSTPSVHLQEQQGRAYAIVKVRVYDQLNRNKESSCAAARTIALRSEDPSRSSPAMKAEKPRGVIVQTRVRKQERFHVVTHTHTHTHRDPCTRSR